VGFAAAALQASKGHGAPPRIGLNVGRRPPSPAPPPDPAARAPKANGSVIGGGAHAADIEAVVHLHMGQFRRCYLNGLRKNPALAGTVRVRFDLDARGDVTKAQDDSSDLPDAGVVACVVSLFRTLLIEGAGPSSAGYAIAFAPE
jgi:hypothetical protein